MKGRTWFGRRWGKAPVLLAVTVVAVSSCSTASTSGSSTPAKAGPITVGGLFPFTGAKSEVSSWGTHGVDTALYEVNQNGGVLGRKLTVATADDAADSVDALPALRKLLLSNPSVIIGPFSPTIEAVINQFEPNHVPDFMLGGITSLDNMNHPYVFRTTASDSTEAVAMAYYAIQKGYKTASLIFDNSANSQGFVAPLTAAFEKLGGTITSNISLVPDQSSYRSELVSTFAKSPQVVFASFDTQTASTLWSDARQLGYLNTAWIGDDLMAGSVYAKAFGSSAPAHLGAAVPEPPGGPAYQHFLSDYKAVFHTSTPLPIASNVYDAVLIAALAMTKAGSTDPAVWVKDVVDVASPPGVVCTDYAACVTAIKSGQDINFDGAGGADDFNAHHNVFGGFSIVGFKADLTTNTQLGTVTSAEVAQAAG